MNSLFSTSEKVLDILFNAISTVIIAICDNCATIAVVALLFLLSVKFYYYVARHMRGAGEKSSETYSFKEYAADLRDGIVQIKEHGEILKLFIPIYLVNFFYGIATVALPIIGKMYISSQAYGYGGLLVCASVGGVVGTFIIGNFKNIVHKHAAFTGICLFAAGISWILMACSLKWSMVFPFVFIFISNAFICMMNIVFVVLIQNTIEVDCLGRVSTLTESMASIMVPIGNVAGGIIIVFVSPIYVEILYGAALVLCAVPYLFFPKNRRKHEII